MSFVQQTIFGFFILAIAACNSSAPIAEESKTPQPAISESFPEDTIIAYDAMKGSNDSLDAASQVKLFKMVLKPSKAKTLYDFSAISPDKLLEVYRNFDKTFHVYKDSASVYNDFLNTLYKRLEEHELIISDKDTTLNVRTKLEIARLKSQIRDGMAIASLNHQTSDLK